VRIYNNDISVGDTVVAIEHGFDYVEGISQVGRLVNAGETVDLCHDYKRGDKGVVASEVDDSCFNVRFSNGLYITGCWSVKFKKVEVERPDTRVWATRRK
jgi:hypothetical protein